MNTLSLLRNYNNTRESGGDTAGANLRTSLQQLLDRELRGGAPLTRAQRSISLPAAPSAPKPAPAKRAVRADAAKKLAKKPAPKPEDDDDADLDALIHEVAMPAKDLAAQYTGIGPLLKKKGGIKRTRSEGDDGERERPPPRKNKAKDIAAAAAEAAEPLDSVEERDDEDEDEEKEKEKPKAKEKAIRFNEFEDQLAQRAFVARNPQGKIGLDGLELQGLKLSSARGKLSALRAAARAVGEAVPVTSVKWALKFKTVISAVKTLESLSAINSIKSDFLALQQTAYTEAYDADVRKKIAERDEWLKASKAYSDEASACKVTYDKSREDGEPTKKQKDNYVDFHTRLTKWFLPLENQAAAIAATTEPEDYTEDQFKLTQQCALIAWFTYLNPLRNKFYHFLNTAEEAPAADDTAALDWNWYVAPDLVVVNEHKTLKHVGRYEFRADAASEAGWVRAQMRYVAVLRAWLGKPTGAIPMWVGPRSRTRYTPDQIGKIVRDSANRHLGKKLGAQLLRTYDASENNNILASNGKRGLVESARRAGHNARTRATVYSVRLPGKDQVAANLRAALGAGVADIQAMTTEDLRSIVKGDAVKFLIAGLEELEARELAGTA